jgi:hypothetical protein
MANGLGSCGVGAWSVDAARAGAREMLAPRGMAPRSCGIVPAIPVSPQRTGAVGAGALVAGGGWGGGGGGFDMRNTAGQSALLSVAVQERKREGGRESARGEPPLQT